MIHRDRCYGQDSQQDKYRDDFNKGETLGGVTQRLSGCVCLH
ncbi:hypothetical protein NY78_1905 [Desulfovibrio sp. TomC]|nr:hypothetical protein NY78_1905 [Desulfovibrio sp. TomC]